MTNDRTEYQKSLNYQCITCNAIYKGPFQGRNDGTPIPNGNISSGFCCTDCAETYLNARKVDDKTRAANAARVAKMRADLHQRQHPPYLRGSRAGSPPVPDQ